MDHLQDRVWMRRALRLASLSLGMTWPNPGVGCVIVREGRELGRGRHERCGAAHAETAALTNVQARGQDPRGATIYVTLAPCTRHGRQPPCVEALIAAGVKRVVAATTDPHQDDPAPILATAGIAYDVGCERALADHLHGGFLCRIAHGRPRFTGKWAMTIDGAIAARHDAPLAISDGPLRELSRRRRRAFDAILIGAGTLRADDPRLDCPVARRHRHPDGDDHGPLRVVLAGRSPLPRAARMWQGRSLIIHDAHANLGDAPGERRCVSDVRDLNAVAKALGQYGLNEVLVEGGAQIHANFLRAGLFDRIEQSIGPFTLGGGVGWNGESGGSSHWRRESIQAISDGALIRWRRD